MNRARTIHYVEGESVQSVKRSARSLMPLIKWQNDSDLDFDMDSDDSDHHSYGDDDSDFTDTEN